MWVNVSLDYIVMSTIALGALLSIFMFVRRKNIKRAFFAAIIAQTFTWPLGLLFVAWGKISYPVRLFPKAIDNSFLHGYVLNPVVFAIYFIHYPKQAKLILRWMYTLIISAIPVSIELAESRYTNLVKYINWNPFYDWALGLITYFIMRKYLDWFFKNVPVQGVSRNEN